MTHVVERYITDLKKDIYKYIYVQAIHCKGKEVSGVKTALITILNFWNGGIKKRSNYFLPSSYHPHYSTGLLHKSSIWRTLRLLWIHLKLFFQTLLDLTSSLPMFWKHLYYCPLDTPRIFSCYSFGWVMRYLSC